MKSLESNLPSLDVSKGSNASEEARAQVAEDLKGFQFELAGKPIDTSVEQREAVQELVANQQEWMEKVLGLSAKQRIEGLGLENKIKFFHPEEWKKIRDQFPHPRILKGLNYAPSNVILLEKEEDMPEAASFAVLNHEIAHALSRQKVRLQQEASNVDVFLMLYGYQNATNGTFTYFNEIITESINLETLVYLYQNKSKALLGHINEAYKRGMIWLNMIIEKLAVSTQQRASDIRLALYRAYFTGDYSMLKTIHQTFGRDALDALAHTPVETEDSPDMLKDIGEKFFGIDAGEFETRMRNYDEGRGVEILPGVTWKKNVKE